MTGAGHLSSAFLIKSKFKAVPFWALLLASEAIELTWVCLNLNFIKMNPPLEITDINLPFSYIGDMKLIQQFISHSFFGALATACILGLIFKFWKKIDGIFLAVFLGVIGHWCADFLAHDKDLPIFISIESIKVGAILNFDSSHPDLGFFTTAPILGFLFQSSFSILCAFLFLKTFPIQDSKKKTHFWILILLVNVLSCGVFLHGVMTKFIQSSTAFILVVFADIIVNAILLSIAARISEKEAVFSSK